MSRPHVTVHNMTSADGRIDHFAGDIGLYYELVAELPHDAVLAGSGTLVAGAAAEEVDLDSDDPAPRPPAGVLDNPADPPRDPADPRRDPADPPSDPAGASGQADERPLLVVVDSGGRLTRFAWLRAQPYWRDLLVLCSASTPASQLDRLSRHRVDHLVIGTERVDLAAALATLAADYGVRRVRVDAGGRLNGALLRAGLVDEVSLLLAPYAVGGRSPSGLFVADDLTADAAVAPLALDSVRQLRGDVVWLRYRVDRGRIGDRP